jgi:hypothetical protein
MPVCEMASSSGKEVALTKKKDSKEQEASCRPKKSVPERKKRGFD